MTDFAEIEVLTESITIALLVTLSAVVGITVLMPGVHSRNALVLSCVMFLCCVEIIGFIALSGVKFWSQTLCQIVIAIGLAVDYSIHIGHVFSTTYEPEKCATRVQRASFALSTMGSSVLRGAITTVLGMVPLLFGSFAALDEFARSIFIIVLTGVFHGFLLLPLALATFGDDPAATAAAAQVKEDLQPSSDTTSNRTSSVADVNVQDDEGCLDQEEKDIVGQLPPSTLPDGSEPSTPPESPLRLGVAPPGQQQNHQPLPGLLGL